MTTETMMDLLRVYDNLRGQDMVPCTIKFSLTFYCETVNKGWLQLVLFFRVTNALRFFASKNHLC